jgi:hypothetical protein
MPKPQTPTQPPKQRTRGLSRYKRSETRRLLKGAADAGLTVRGLEVDAVTGDLRVLVGKPGEPSDNSNSWDEVLNVEDAKRPA